MNQFSLSFLPLSHVAERTFSVPRDDFTRALKRTQDVVREIDTKITLTPEISQYMQKLVEIFEQYAKMSHHLAFEGVMATLDAIAGEFESFRARAYASSSSPRARSGYWGMWACWAMARSLG